MSDKTLRCSEPSSWGRLDEGGMLDAAFPFPSPRGAYSSVASPMTLLFTMCIIVLCIQTTPCCVASGICGCEHRFELLMEFYNATNGPQWKNSAGWGTIYPCGAAWYGVMCVNGNITAVELLNNHLTGTLPASWKDMVFLTQLALSNNSITGPLPDSWSKMNGLQKLYLYNNSLSGSLPESWSALSFLSELDLSRNRFSGSLPASWSSMSRLQFLYLFHSSLSGALPAAWSSLSSLEELKLFNNNLSGALPESWGTLPALKFLDMLSNHFVGTLPASWSSMRALEYLYLFNNSLTGSLPASWSQMPSIGYIVVYNNGLTGTLPDSWSRMSSLVNLYLFQNALHGTIPASWGKGMISLERLSISENSLSGQVPSEVFMLPHLLWLSVAFNNFSGALPATCSPTISVLDFQNNSGVYGVIPAGLGLFAVTVCGTDVCPLAQWPLQYCRPPGVNFESVDDPMIYLSKCSPKPADVPALQASHTRSVVDVLWPTTRDGASAAAATSVAYTALLAGGSAVARGAVPALQRASASMRLMSYCGDTDKGVPTDAVNEDPLFSSLADNPLSVTVPFGPAEVGHAAGASIGNTALVCGIGLMLHLCSLLQRRMEKKSSSARGRVQRCVVKATLLLPSSMLPGSLAVGYATLLQPTIGACMALIIIGAEQGSVKSVVVCGVVVLSLWIGLPLFYVWFIVHRGRTNDGLFLLTRVSSSATTEWTRNSKRPNARQLHFTAMASKAWTYMTQSPSEWSARRSWLTNEGRRTTCIVRRSRAQYMLERLDAVFGAYVERREWFFLVEWGVCAVGGAVVLGVAEALASMSDSNDAACTVARWGVWCAIGIGAAEVALSLWLRPYAVRIEQYVTVVVGLLMVVCEVLALSGELSAASSIALGTSIAEVVLMATLMLLDGVQKLYRRPRPQCHQGDSHYLARATPHHHANITNTPRRLRASTSNQCLEDLIKLACQMPSKDHPSNMISALYLKTPPHA